ncbi:MAG: hypothetical protein EXS67_06475 [Candidatus Margulisbacteria bacterium]|nr:hypothetical protein [Candidatus Margulisiibacteriota bacterium]
MSIRKKIKPKHLVSLNTAHIKLRSQHPRISEDLYDLFLILREEIERPESELYKEDGYIDID